ncbi:MAG TPA: hypothetical protein VM619_14890 [Luteimonas sp.]|nr:hypothetical protein [Luteimonas sp.]
MGKSSEQTVGYHYRPAYHVIITRGPIDAFIALAGADKIAWDGRAVDYNDNGKTYYKQGGNRPIYFEHLDATGALTASGSIQVAAPNLFGGEDDQGGILGRFDIMFGEADQLPNPYLQAVFGNQTAAWRGLTTVACCGARFGAMNPMPQKPSYKVRKIFNGWDIGECWYPAKASVPMADLGPDVGGFVLGRRVVVTADVAMPDQVLEEMAIKYDWSYTDSGEDYHFFRGNESGLVRAKDPEGDGDDLSAVVGLIDEGWQLGQTAVIKFHSGHLLLCVITDVNEPPTAPEGAEWAASPGNPMTTDLGVVYLWEMDVLTPVTRYLEAMNAAHALVYCRTDREKGREPFANIDDENMQAAADILYGEGFGLCWEFDPERDTPDSFEEQVCRIIGGSFERSIIDGKWRLQLARADYDLDSLSVLGEDAGLILSFRELPITLDQAVNCLGVRYFDIEAKESRTIWARAPGLARQFGEIKEILEYPWIPTGTLAAKVVERELRDRITPRRSFEVDTDPSFRHIVRNETVRFRLPSRGIAEMVCIVGQKENGTLTSGAIRWKLTQHVYSFGDAVYVEVEPGVDTSPPQVPAAVVAAFVFEAPYLILVTQFARPDLQALPDDAGFLLAAAAAPTAGLNFTLAVQPSGGDYGEAGTGDWCPTATVVGAVAGDMGPTVVSIANGSRLGAVDVGMAVAWDNEWCRLDDIDLDTMTATLARGCADTVAQPHADGARLWFIGGDLAADSTEYTDGEAVNAKLLTNTASQQLPLGSAVAIPLTFDGRQARPYPPAALTVNDDAAPAYLFGELTLEWRHRDRVLQADQLVDQATASIGPEPGTLYTVRCYLDGVLDDTQTSIAGATATVSPSDSGLVRIEVEAVRGGLASWQAQVREFNYTVAEADPLLINGEPLLINGDPVYLE